MDKAAIVIIHYNGEADTRECINSILINHKKGGKFYTIVVDNSAANKASFVSDLKKDYPDLVIIENKINTGFAGGNNIGIRKALDLGCKYILLLNNDTIVSLEMLDKLLAFAQSDDQIGLVSPKIYFAKGYEYHKDRYKNEEKGRVIWYAGGILDRQNIYASHRGVDEVDHGQYDQTAETDFSVGCCMFINKKTIEQVGLFDERYFLYYEDIDYSERVKRKGMKIIYYPGTFLWHKNASSSGKPGSKLHIYFQNRNRLYFGFKYASLYTKKSLFLDSLRILKKGSVYSKSVIDYYLGRMGGANL